MKVQQLNLDFDKAGDNAKDGAKAIAHALKKYTFEDETAWKIGGGSSDSGGQGLRYQLAYSGSAGGCGFLH